VCNLYSITTNQEAIRALFRVVNRYVGNLAPMPGVFPDYPAPVVRNAGRTRVSHDALGHAATAEGRRAAITNIRNVPNQKEHLRPATRGNRLPALGK
jgi:putative SOS response-associated peptidase YedK